MNGAVFSADGNYVATVSEGGADVWELNAQSGPSRKAFSTLSSTRRSSACRSSFVFSPDGTRGGLLSRVLRILGDRKLELDGYDPVATGRA
jgi:hypothetical protein